MTDGALWWVIGCIHVWVFTLRDHWPHLPSTATLAATTPIVLSRARVTVPTFLSGAPFFLHPFTTPLPPPPFLHHDISRPHKGMKEGGERGHPAEERPASEREKEREEDKEIGKRGKRKRKERGEGGRQHT